VAHGQDIAQHAQGIDSERGDELDRPNPALWPAAILSSPRASGTPLSFIARNAPSSSESRPIVTRDRAASPQHSRLADLQRPVVVSG
jgi:hypothetical protein